jgi:hypothetical protein
MVRHIVVWELKPEQKPNAEKIAAELGAKFHALLGVVDGLREIELGRNYNGGRFDLMLNCVFDSSKAQAAYQTHPAHVAIKAVVHTLVCSRECVDCEIGEK